MSLMSISGGPGMRYEPCASPARMNNALTKHVQRSVRLDQTRTKPSSHIRRCISDSVPHLCARACTVVSGEFFMPKHKSVCL